MSLNVGSLKSDLFNCFEAMNKDTSGDNRIFAQKLSKAVADYAESGDIKTVDAGTIPSGVFAGSGEGSISVQSIIAENIIYAACVAMNSMSVGGDDYLALQIATGIQAMMTAGVVDTDVKGTCTPPTPATPFPMAGKAKGVIVCVQAPLYASIKAAFLAMQNMKENGNLYMADKISSAVDTYLKAGVVTTNGLGSLVESIGGGAMS